MSRRFIGLIPGGGGGGIDLGAAGNTTGTLATISSGTAVLAGGNNITLSQNGQNITISAGGGTLGQLWAVPNRALGTLSRDQFTGGTMAIWPMGAEVNMSFTQANAIISVSLSTSSNSSYSVNVSLGLAAYTRNGSTLSLASSGSQSYAFTITGNSSTASYTGVRFLSLPFSANFTPGDYWFAASSSTATTNTNWATISNFVFSQGNLNSVAVFGAATNASNQLIPGWGIFSASSSAFPAAIGFTDIKGSNQTGYEFPIFNLVNYTA